jgi:hypothetical protein
MKRNLYLDSTTGDLALSNFQLRLTSTLTEYMAQKIENVLMTFAGEWFLDYTIGIPYFDRVLIKTANINSVRNIFLIAITDIPEVEKVLEFVVDYVSTTREYSISFKIKARNLTDPVENTILIGGR